MHNKTFAFMMGIIEKRRKEFSDNNYGRKIHSDKYSEEEKEKRNKIIFFQSISVTAKFNWQITSAKINFSRDQMAKIIRSRN